MDHKMRLDPILFDEIDSGVKTIEVRLNDEKRGKLNVGDIIIFYKRPDCVQEVGVKVMDLSTYDSIKQLVDSTPISYWGPRFQTKEQLLKASWPYTPEEIKKYGLLAIKISKYG